MLNKLIVIGGIFYVWGFGYNFQYFSADAIMGIEPTSGVWEGSRLPTCCLHICLIMVEYRLGTIKEVHTQLRIFDIIKVASRAGCSVYFNMGNSRIVIVKVS